MYKKIVEMMQAMRDGGKEWPTFSLISEGNRPVKLNLSGPKSKYPGSVTVTDGARYPDNVWYGSINPGGVLWPNKNITDDARADIIALMKLFASDTTSALEKYGRETGNCGICSLELTAPESHRRNYGPTCADKCGLPFDHKLYRQELYELRKAAKESLNGRSSAKKEEEKEEEEKEDVDEDLFEPAF